MNNEEYMETWFSTIALQVLNHRGRGANDIARYCDCSASTFRKYAEIMIKRGEMCVIDYGNSYNADNRYYMLSDATRIIVDPLGIVHNRLSEQSDDAWNEVQKTEYGTEARKLAHLKYSVIEDMEWEVWRDMQYLLRLAVKCGNS